MVGIFVGQLNLLFSWTDHKACLLTTSSEYLDESGSKTVRGSSEACKTVVTNIHTLVFIE